MDVEAITEAQCDQRLHLSTPTNDAQPERQQSTTDSVKSSNFASPQQHSAPAKRSSDDISPGAKRCRRSPSNSTPPKHKFVETTEYTTPTRTSPLKDFSIVLSDSLKSPIKSPVVGNKVGTISRSSQSPKQCVVLLYDIKSPSRIVASSNTPTDNGSKRILRSASVSPKQRCITGQDPLVASPIKERTPGPSPSNIHTITDISPKHTYRSRDILLASSSQATPQKEYY